MRTLTTLLLLVYGMSHGQNMEFSFNNIVKLHPTFTKPKGYKTQLFIALKLTSNNPKYKNNHKVMWMDFMSDPSQSKYDSVVKSHGRYYNSENRRKDIVISVCGESTEYTFEEFRKILWPN